MYSRCALLRALFETLSEVFYNLEGKTVAQVEAVLPEPASYPGLGRPAQTALDVCRHLLTQPKIAVLSVFLQLGQGLLENIYGTVTRPVNGEVGHF